MNDVATRQDQVPATSETGALLSVIERVAMSPEADISKLEKMLDMQERVLNRQAEQEFSRAMNAAQSQMGRVSADANNPQTRSKYASYAALDRALRPVYSEQGFSLSFDTDERAPETVKVLCHVFHASGHTKTYSVVMPADGKGAKGGDVMTKTHAAGAAMSYGMRYLLKMIFNVAVGEDDVDGNAPQRTQKPSEKPGISNDRLEKAIGKINAGEYSVQRLNKSFALTEPQKKRVQTDCDIAPEEVK